MTDETVSVLSSGDTVQPDNNDSLGRPLHWIGNGCIKAMIYLPDPKRGHYRGPRFDWSGMIGAVHVNGHRFFGPFKPGSDLPEEPDCNAVGLADEYGMATPLGYTQARPEETFIKIGIGWLVREDESHYRFARKYHIARAADWLVTFGSDWIEFHQDLNDPRGWGYAYTKHIDLIADGTQLVVRHKLSNTGTKLIDTEQYCHNFIRFGDELVGPGYSIVVPFDLLPERAAGVAGVAEFEARCMVIKSPIGLGKSIYVELASRSEHPFEYGATITNGQDSVMFDSQCVPKMFRFYCSATAICAEAFIPIRLEAGEKMTWDVRYSFDISQT